MKKIYHFVLILICFNFYITNIQAQKSSPDKPKLIVTIVIDKMRYDFLYRYWDKYDNNGFKRLINNGMFCKNANYNYLLTQSSSGYATIATGTEPFQHGIIADNWYERLKDQKRYCTSDSKVKSVGTVSDCGKMSPSQLLCSTISDELKITTFKQSKVIGISTKDYAAIYSVGHLANAAYWIDPKTQNWISSSYYFQILPDWVSRFNEKKFPDLYLTQTWSTTYDIKDYTESLADNNSYEKGFPGGKRTFPYNTAELQTDWGNNDVINYTPFGNTYTKDFAISAIVNEDLGKDKYTDYLSIGFSANSNVSDLFGIRSVEIEDMYIKLDKDIEHLIQFIDEYVGKENTLIILTSDRGNSDSPDFLQDIRVPSDYFKAQSAFLLLKSYMRALYGQGEWVKSFFDQQIYLNRDLIEDSKLSLTEVQQKVASFMVGFQGVANAMTSTSFDTQNFTKGTIEKAQNSYNQSRSGDIIINLAPGIAATYHDNEAYLPNRCSAYKSDTHVPLIWYGWKIKKGIIEEPVSISDIAPTIANLINIAYPNASTGKPIIYILKD